MTRRGAAGCHAQGTGVPLAVGFAAAVLLDGLDQVLGTVDHGGLLLGLLPSLAEGLGGGIG
jgi:hypothetical protein